MATPVEVPRLGESVTTAILVQWLKEDGATVKKDEAICILETDKANVDLPSPAAGVLRQMRKAGETVNVGDAVAQIETSVTAGAAATAKTPAPAAQPAASLAQPARTSLEDLSPAVRTLVQEHKLDPNALARTAPGGRLTKEYVLSYLESNQSNLAGANGEKATAVLPESPSSKNAPPPPSAPVSVPPKGAGATERLSPELNAPPQDFDSSGERRVKMSKIRQSIAKRLVQAQQTAAILTTFNEVDLTEVMALRAKFKERF